MKTILSAIFTVALVSVLVGAGTFAYYTDTEVSSDNTFTAGEFDLYLTNTQPNPNALWTISNGAPGDFLSYASNDLRMHHLGTIDANHITITFSLDEYEDDDGDGSNGHDKGPESDPIDGVGEMASALKVDSMTYRVVGEGATEIILVNGFGYNGDYLTNTNPLINNYIDLEDLRDPDNSLYLSDVPKAIGPTNVPDEINYAQLVMAISLVDTGEPQNEFQGDIIDMTITVTLDQE